VRSGWQSACLGDVLAVLKNGLNCKQDRSGYGQRISRIESISLASFDLARVGYAEISDQDRSKFRLLNGDILFSHINSPIHVGKTAVFDIDEEVYHGVNLLLMRPTPAVSGAYLEMYLKYLFEKGYWLSVCKQSVNQASVNQQDISRVPISFPSEHAEQQRIIAILDEAFEGIATAKANAEKNLQNAGDFIKSHVRTMLYENPKGWDEKPFEDCIDDVKYTVKIQRKNFLDEGVYPVVSQEAGLINGYWNQANDVYRVGSPIIVFGDHTKALKYIDFDFVLGADGVKILAPKSFLVPKFFFHYVRGMSIESLGYARHYRILKQSKISFPDKIRQAEIADAVDNLEADIQALCRIFELKIAALDELKKSLLHQAFTGQL
jgi:restriction endonuclease S subunit